jgi:hypothetical protein
LIPLADANLWRELGLVYDQDRTLPRAAAEFINLVEDGFLQSKSIQTVHNISPDFTTPQASTSAFS